MSTRRSILYDATYGVHVYVDLDGYVHCEIEKDGVNLSISLMPLKAWNAMIVRANAPYAEEIGQTKP